MKRKKDVVHYQGGNIRLWPPGDQRIKQWPTNRDIKLSTCYILAFLSVVILCLILFL